MTSSIEAALAELKASPTKASKLVTAVVPTPQLPALPYTNESLLDYLVANPSSTPESVSAAFRRSKRWFLTVLATDAFQSMLDAKRHLLSDPTITSTLEERYRALSLQALDVLQQKLEGKEVSDLLVLKASELSVKALGMGMTPAPAQPLTPSGNVDTLAERLVAALEKQRRNVRAPTTFEQSSPGIVEVSSGS